ncbi:hypothetical protein ACGFYY_01220 [Streptomyces sp. NPDC048331]|uniref:hypothetical protein n=1 Tax=Streptomyces sp. NPDC048331 TaxID=3365534 RepID=UPI0037233C75
MTVSPRAEQALCEAMERLLSGKPSRTDGALTKNNLWREAGVSRATMNRATSVLAEWDSRVDESPATALDRQRREELSEVRGNLRKSRQECRQLQDQVDAAATVIAVLLAENAAFREQLAKRSAVVIPLDRTSAIRE